MDMSPTKTLPTTQAKFLSCFYVLSLLLLHLLLKPLIRYVVFTGHIPFFVIMSFLHRHRHGDPSFFSSWSSSRGQGQSILAQTMWGVEFLQSCSWSKISKTQGVHTFHASGTIFLGSSFWHDDTTELEATGNHLEKNCFALALFPNCPSPCFKE